MRTEDEYGSLGWDGCAARGSPWRSAGRYSLDKPKPRMEGMDTERVGSAGRMASRVVRLPKRRSGGPIRRCGQQKDTTGGKILPHRGEPRRCPPFVSRGPPAGRRQNPLPFHPSTGDPW